MTWELNVTHTYIYQGIVKSIQKWPNRSGPIVVKFVCFVWYHHYLWLRCFWTLFRLFLWLKRCPTEESPCQYISLQSSSSFSDLLLLLPPSVWIHPHYYTSSWFYFLQYTHGTEATLTSSGLTLLFFSLQSRPLMGVTVFSTPSRSPKQRTRKWALQQCPSNDHLRL